MILNSVSGIPGEDQYCDEEHVFNFLGSMADIGFILLEIYEVWSQRCQSLTNLPSPVQIPQSGRGAFLCSEGQL